MSASREAALVAALREVEFGSCDGCGRGGYCLWCSRQEEFDYEAESHLPNCPVGLALAAPVEPHDCNDFMREMPGLGWDCAKCWAREAA
jgi:hypothetical protein